MSSTGIIKAAYYKDYTGLLCLYIYKPLRSGY